MIGISRLWCGLGLEADALRYGETRHGGGFATAVTAASRRPIVVWNCTRSCNLRCLHCYADCKNHQYDDEMTTGQGRMLIDQLAEFGSPSLLFSGGEPLMRHDLFTLVELARQRGLRTVLSTNGTLITDEIARRLKDVGMSYVGISLDGIGEVNDRFRGMEGAFVQAVEGFRACVRAGVRVGLRLTLTRHNVDEIDGIFDFIRDEGVDRACFYHLVPTGRGRSMKDSLLPHDVERKAMARIMDLTKGMVDGGRPVEVLTVDNHCDGVYLYRRLREIDPERAATVRKLLEWNGGAAASSGVGIGCVDWFGEVHPDQFWRHLSFGNIRDRPFGEIWQDVSHPIMAGLKNRVPLLKGKCGECHYQKACGGSMRARAEAVHGDPWAEDPACYLTHDEVTEDE